MSTSLAEQLKRLAIPQTKVLVDAKKRASLLFDPLEAAKLSKESVFEIGCEGLRELIKIDKSFSKFKETLFDNESKSIQRAVESKEVNKKIDKLISKFLMRLSPYLLLKASHKALEWLIYRYQVHEVNVTQLFALILPYHEANIFVKVLQLIDLKANVFKSWLWLEPLQKQGLHLPRQVLITHGISDSSFLRFICETTEKSLKEHLKTKSEFKLRTQFAFYASVLVGVLERGSTNDHILTVLLPSLLNGLVSTVADYKAAAYMATGHLITNNQLEPVLCSKLLQIIIEDDSETMSSNRIYLLLMLFQTQQTPLSLNFEQVKKQEQAMSLLVEIAKEGILVGPLVIAAVEACMERVINQQTHDADPQVLCWSLVERISCDELSARKLLRILISYFERIKPVKDNKRRKVAGEVDASAADWLTVLIEALCAKYADVFDKVQDREFQNIRRQWTGEDTDEVLDSQIASLVRRCSGTGQATAWRHLKPLLLKQIDENKMFKACTKASPPDEPLTLLIMLERIVRPVGTSVAKRILVSKLVESPYGSRNPFILHLKKLLEENTDLAIDEAVSRVIEEKWCVQSGLGFTVKQWVCAINEMRNSQQFNYVNSIWLFALKMLIPLIPTEASPEESFEIINALAYILSLKMKHQLEILEILIARIKNCSKLKGEWVDLNQKDLSICIRVKVLEICLTGLHQSTRHHDKFITCLNEFFDNCFCDGAALKFVSTVAAGLPFSSCMEVLVSPLLQVYGIHYLWQKLSHLKDQGVIKQSFNQMTTYLLLALSNSSMPIRCAAVKWLEIMVSWAVKEKLVFATLLKELKKRSNEITADREHLSVALFCLLSPENSVQMTLNKKIASALNADREELISLLISSKIPLYVAARLSVLLEAVTSVKVMKDMTPLARRALESKGDFNVSNTMLASYWLRLNAATVEALFDSGGWRLAVDSLAHQKCNTLCPGITFLKAISKELFAALNMKQQEDLLELLVSTRASTENPAVSSAVATVCKKVILDGSVILKLLDKMVATLPKELNIASSSILESRSWRLGVALLELIQNKKKIRESRLVIRALFAILKFCLDQEEQTAFEYAKQLVLGCLLEICERHVVGGEHVETATLDVELIVQCLRASSNPQTHHHALLLLSLLGSIIPVSVMHNIMAIFTFMGSSVARLDDEHSVQVVTKVVDTIVPVLVKSLDLDLSKGDAVVAEVLRIFVWTLRDVPQHRRIPLFSRLLTTLEPERSLWIFLLLLFENYVVSAHKTDKSTEGSMPPTLQLGMELCLSFGPQVILNTTLKLIHYLIEVPIEKMNPNHGEKPMDIEENAPSDGLFNINKHSPKQLRHYTYTLFTFLNTLLADQNLILQVRELETVEAEKLESVFKDAMAALLLYTPLCAAQQQLQLTKFWKTMVTLGYDVLDRLVTLISSETLVGVITKLLRGSEDALRRKAVDLLNVHIQTHRGGFAEDEKRALNKLVNPLLAVAISPAQTSGDGELIQQTALLSLRLLAKVLAPDDPQAFKQVLVDTSRLCRSKGHLLASAALTVADLVTHLKVHAVSELHNFLPALLKGFSAYVSTESTDIVLMSLAASLYRIVETLASFLSPYMDNLLYSVSCLATQWPEAGDLNRKLVQIRQKVALGVAHRVLIPSLSRCYSRLVEEGRCQAVGPLLSMLADSLVVVPDVSRLLTELAPFYIQVLQIRSDAADGIVNISDEEVFLVEGFGIDALLPLVLKLSELSFKPLYYQIFHWASEHSHRTITFYRLSSKLAEGLKGLFVLFAGHFLQNAATLLDAINVNKAEKPYFGTGPAAEAKAILLLENIVQTLHTVFLFDSTTFLSKEKFQALLHPLVDQLDNTLGGPEALQDRSKRLLIPCLAQMTLATDDTQWKTLNYQLLTKTRHSSPLVRIAALRTVVEVAAKLGEDYLPLLPETIGSLAELLEDEDERVEEAMKDALRRMEDDLGQPIREYFQ